MIIDCHCHLEEEMLPLDKMIESMDKSGIHKTALITRLSPPFYVLSDPKKDKLKKLVGKIMLDYSILGRMAYKSSVKKGTFLLLGEKIKILDTPDNDSVLQAINKYPNRFLGWIFTNPTLQGTEIEEVDKLQSHPNIIGVKLHPYFYNYKIETVEKLATYCQEHNLPMLIHLSAQSNCYHYLPEKFPTLKIIYAHAGLPHWRKLWQDMYSYKNVYIDLSSVLTKEVAELAVKAMGYHKCLYGTDGPYGMSQGGTYDYSSVVNMIEHLNLTNSQKEAVLGNTFSSLIR
ncbi:MAG: TatD family hydrolase [Desulfosporosinus sp.]|nr:TatD family hydrolase [Desulfosporosinus sp.]